MKMLFLLGALVGAYFLFPQKTREQLTAERKTLTKIPPANRTPEQKARLAILNKALGL